MWFCVRGSHGIRSATGRTYGPTSLCLIDIELREVAVVPGLPRPAANHHVSCSSTLHGPVVWETTGRSSRGCGRGFQPLKLPRFPQRTDNCYKWGAPVPVGAAAPPVHSYLAIQGWSAFVPRGQCPPPPSLSAFLRIKLEEYREGGGVSHTVRVLKFPCGLPQRTCSYLF